MAEANIFPALIARIVRVWLCIPSRKFYDGLSAVYDYGQKWPPVKKKKQNICDFCGRAWPSSWEYCGVGLMRPFCIPQHGAAKADNLEATRGWLIRACDKRYRADHLIEASVDRNSEKKCVQTTEQKAKWNYRRRKLPAIDDFAGLKKLDCAIIQCALSEPATGLMSGSLI